MMHLSKNLAVLALFSVLGCTSSKEGSSATDSDGTDPDGTDPDGTDPDGTDPDAITRPPTYYQDVAPILQANCVPCHSADNIAPFSLDGPELAQVLAGSIAEVVSAGTMPPWPPGPLSPEMLHARTLTAAQIATLTAWAEAKAPLGDPANPAAPGIADEVDIGVADLSFDIGVDYTADTNLNDDYRCFLVDMGITEDRMITGYRITPGNRKTVHHVITTLFAASDKAELEAIDAASAGPGWSCLGGPVPWDGTLKPESALGSWVPGVSSVLLPAGTGGQIRAGDFAVVQVHYSVGADRGPDRTRVELKFAPQDKSADLQELETLGLSKLGIFLPAYESDIVEERTRTAAEWMPNRFYSDGKAQVVSVAGHMHTLGTKLTIERTNAEGTTVLLDIPAWDFHWQGSYTLAEPISIVADDKLTIRCTYDNTLEQREANDWPEEPIVDVRWGEGTFDEMCSGNLTLVNRPPVVARD